MSQSLSLTHLSSTLQYLPLSNWIVTPDSHTTATSSASVRLEWTGRGIQVNGRFSRGNSPNQPVPFSLDGSQQNQGPVDDKLLINSTGLSFGNHTLIITNPDGGNLTVLGVSMENKGSEPINVNRVIYPTVQSGSGGYIQNPEFSFGGNWVIGPNTLKANPPNLAVRPSEFYSFAYNISECSKLQIYGIGPTYSASVNLVNNKNASDTYKDNILATGSELVEDILLQSNLHRTDTYSLKINLELNRGPWTFTRMVLSNEIAGSSSTSSTSASPTSTSLSSSKSGAKSIGLYVGIIVPVVTVVMVLFILCCCCRRKKGATVLTTPPMTTTTTKRVGWFNVRIRTTQGIGVKYTPGVFGAK